MARQRRRAAPVRTFALSLVALSALLVHGVQGAAAFDCKDVNQGKRHWDLSGLDGVHSFETTLETPPTKVRTRYTVSLCSALPASGDSAKEDTCPEGTRVCVVSTNIKPGQDDRVISVVPVAGEIGHGELDPRVSTVDGGKGKAEELVIELHGGQYVDKEQRARISLICDKEAKDSQPALTSYSEGTLKLEWRSPHACATDAKAPSDDDSGEPGGLGFFGWLFLLLFLGFLGYFVIGAYHRYTTYGSTGVDVIPHRDFWQDLPYVLRDLVKGRGGSRDGYSAF